MTDIDRQLRRNRTLSQGTERIAVFLVRAGASIFKAFINFLKEMGNMVLGK